MNTQTLHIHDPRELISHFPPLTAWARVYLTGDLWAGKSTYVRTYLRTLFGDELVVRSPTYTYFEKYGENIYHFDLYRLESLEDFFLIGWQDILEDPSTICLIEWPEILREYYEPTLRVDITITTDGSRDVTWSS